MKEREMELYRAIGEAEDGFVREAMPASRRSARRWPVMAAAAAAILLLCGFTIHRTGLLDLWFQKPSPAPEETVCSALENQLDKDYTLAMEVISAEQDPAEAARVRAQWTGSPLAESKGWSEELLRDHFTAVLARYRVEYDHSKTFLPDGELEQYFYLIRDPEKGAWTIVDNGPPLPAK